MYGQNRTTDRQTDQPHEFHVYVGLAQARPNHPALSFDVWLHWNRSISYTPELNMMSCLCLFACTRLFATKGVCVYKLCY